MIACAMEKVAKAMKLLREEMERLIKVEREYQEAFQDLIDQNRKAGKR